MKYKNYFSWVGAVVLSCILLFSGIVTANAYETFGYTLNGGVGNYGYNTRYYYVDSSCSSTLVNKIAEAWSDWNYTTASLGITTPISVKKTTTKSSSVFDFYYRTQWEEEDGIYGGTFMYNGQTLQNPTCGDPTGNWGWTQIILNNPNYDDLYYISGNIDRQKGVIAHEIGHALGLAHSDDSVYKLMYPYGDLLYVDSCTADELAGINALY